MTDIDTLLDGAAHWQRKWRRDGVELTNATLEMNLEIIALRRQLRENGVEPIDGEWTRKQRPLPFILSRSDES